VTVQVEKEGHIFCLFICMMKQLFFEAVFVGLLSVVIFVFINYLPFNLIYKLFLVGFIKHYFGYLSGIQSYYCNLYLSKNRNDKYEVESNSILLESLFEGIIYIYIGLLLSKIFTNCYLISFTLGFCLHIISDFYGIHTFFLKNNCHIQK